MATRRVVLNNKQREKTSGQKTREALVLEEVTREMDAAGAGRPGEDSGNSAEFCENNFDWRDEVGDQIGVSRDTVQKGTDIYRMAYPDEYVHDDLQNPEKYDVSEEVREVATAE